jgi:hypothetical protein
VLLVAWLNSACHFPCSSNSSRKASTHHEIGHPKKKPIKIEQRMTIINPKINHSAEDEHPFNPKSFSIMRKPLPLPHSSTLNHLAEHLLRIKNPPPPAHLVSMPIIVLLDFKSHQSTTNLQQASREIHTKEACQQEEFIVKTVMVMFRDGSCFVDFFTSRASCISPASPVFFISLLLS